MREISAELLRRLKSPRQTAAENAAPRAILRVSKKTIPLLDASALKKTVLGTFPTLTAVDVAARHRREDADCDRVYVGFVADGVGRVIWSPMLTTGLANSWSRLSFSAEAVDVAVAFNGTMPRKTDGTMQFVCEEEPWIFWATPEGSCLGKKEGSALITRLAESNCTAVSAVRAVWSRVGSFDFGLVVFMVLAGKLYYRQFLRGGWTDAEPVSFGPEGVEWADVSVRRTQDFRLVLSCRTTEGDVYELFTQFQGIGKQGTEHLELSDAAVNAAVGRIEARFGGQHSEHVQLTEAGVTTRLRPPPQEKEGGAAEHLQVDGASVTAAVSPVRLTLGVLNEAVELADASVSAALTKVEDI